MHLLGLMLSIGAVTVTCALPMQSKEKSCGYPGDIAFGTFEVKNEDGFVFGAIVEYSCDPGYQMISKHKTTECTATGWSRAIPDCEARLCPPVVDDSVTVLSTVFDEEYTVGHVIKLQCKNPNYKLDGPSQIYCTSNGAWNIDPPTCKDPCTLKNDKMEQHNIQVKDYRTHFKHNDVIEFECIPGYEISNPKNLTIKCNEGAITYPTCQMREQKNGKKTCPPPPQVMFGEAMGVKKEMYDEGSIIHFKCLSYFKLIGKKKMKCKDGVWVQPPTCIAPCILNDKYIKGNNTIINATEKYIVHGESVKFECLPTFQTSKPNLLKAVCKNGKLKYPTCNLVPCILNDNYIKGNNTIVKTMERYIVHGETVKFECLPTFRISKPHLLKVECKNGKLKYPTCMKTATDEITVQPSRETEIYQELVTQESCN
ncbi:coagulation factor XIII B chain-like isoform 2-T2 [Mantella aurantiaca]